MKLSHYILVHKTLLLSLLVLRWNSSQMHVDPKRLRSALVPPLACSASMGERVWDELVQTGRNEAVRVVP